MNYPMNILRAFFLVFFIISLTKQQGTSETGEKCVAFDRSEGKCLPLVLCLYAFDNVSDIGSASCEGEAEVCCPLKLDISGRKRPPVTRPEVTEPDPSVVLPTITARDLNSAAREGLDIVREIEALEKELVQKGLTVKPGTKEAFHQAFFGSKPQIHDLGRDGMIGVQATLELVKRFDLNNIQGRGLQRFSLKNTEIEGTCPKEPPCPSSKYRMPDGSCNNLQNPSWGKSFTAFQRLLPPRYADGVDSPRIASDGGPLPRAREISVLANPDKDIPNDIFTLIIMQWAQFLDHDLTLTAITKGQNNEGILCCEPEILKNPRLKHVSCLPLDIPSNDAFYSKFKQTCMEFVRSLPAPNPKCTFGSREQINQLTSYLDGSNIYGSTENETNHLRSFKQGKLKLFKLNGDDLLPKEQGKSEDCQIQRESCFVAGDERVNEQINLAVMHTIWMREHNRVAEELLKQNRGWNDEILFQETRRIVGAELQHITFNEFLPLLLGKEAIHANALRLKQHGHSFDYNPKVNSGIVNAFAAAAYRYGHTLVQGLVDLLEKNGEVSGQLPLATSFFNPILLYRPGFISKFIRGLVGQPAQKYDRFVTDQLTNHLFEPLGTGFGLDLVAINTQRGRDHGIPAYNEWREWCGLGKVKDFKDLETIMTVQSAEAYKKLYRSVDDIDLFTAGISELSVPDGTLGPTFACIVGEQFRRIKFGDRFWYENGKLESSFTEAQLQQIRRASLSRIICDNSKDVDAIQPLAFIRPYKWNPRVPCDSEKIPKINFKPWRNEPVWS